jgi:hypothetical protein
VAVGAASDRRPHHDAVDFHPTPYLSVVLKPKMRY